MDEKRLIIGSVESARAWMSMMITLEKIGVVSSDCMYYTEHMHVGIWEIIYRGTWW